MIPTTSIDVKASTGTSFELLSLDSLDKEKKTRLDARNAIKTKLTKIYSPCSRSRLAETDTKSARSTKSLRDIVHLRYFGNVLEMFDKKGKKMVRGYSFFSWEKKARHQRKREREKKRGGGGERASEGLTKKFCPMIIMHTMSSSSRPRLHFRVRTGKRNAFKHT